MKNRFRYHHKDDGWCYIDFKEDNIAKAFEGYEYRPHCSQLFQSTGKFDKNYVEIFEGSLIKCSYCNDEYGVVVWNQDMLRFQLNWNDSCCGNARLTSIDHWSEVAGDTITTPLLIKQ